MDKSASMLKLARTRIGEKYRLGAVAPKSNKSWHGPWDCAEFASWCLYQTTGEIFGCRPRNGDPARVDAYTGFWAEDAERENCIITVSQAAATRGAFLLRLPGSAIGHIAISAGDGTTVEAHSAATGVMKNVVDGRRWDYGVLVPGLDAVVPDVPEPVRPAGLILRLRTPPMEGRLVKEVQRALKAKGFEPGAIDGMYGGQTSGAVRAFQLDAGLAPDGEVGKSTAKALDLTWP